MKTFQEIKDIKEYLVKDYHSARILQQGKMQNFYDDTFPVPMIKSPQYLSRTGTASWLVDGPASHITTRNPQIVIQPKKMTQTCRDSVDKVNALYNHWIKVVLKQSPQPFKEHVKNNLLRGEGWIYLATKEEWDKEWDDGFPINFEIPDPLNIFGSPIEVHGVPDYLIVNYSISPIFLHYIYPEWVNKTNNKNAVDYWEYWDAEIRCFIAGGYPLLSDEIQENILGFVPFVHSYSGFGKVSPEGRPETLSVGRLDKVTDLLIQECAINSDIDSTIHKFAKPRIDVFPMDADVNGEDLKANYDMGAGALNVVPNILPDNFREGTRILPTPEAFAHFANIRSRIQQEAPPIMSGLPGGTSGRQEDIVGSHFIRRFDSVVEATETAFAKAFDLARNALFKIPTILPITQWLEQPDGGKAEITIDKDDFNNVTDCELSLKVADPIEDDRKLMAGRTLKNEGLIDWETFLTEYAGYTPEKASLIMTRTIAQQVVMTSLLPIIGQKAMEKLGMADELKALQEQQAIQGKMQKELQNSPPNPSNVGSKGGEPRTMNIQSSTGRDMIDVALSQNGVRSTATPQGM